MTTTILEIEEQLKLDINLAVNRAIEEDLGSGDLTAQLVPAGKQATAKIICREQAILCGKAWLDEVYKQIDASVKITWHCADGDTIGENQAICSIQGNARSMLSAERTALNFLQTLSGTATEARRYARRIQGTETIIRDTRKTIPGMRLAQKYAVRCGQCENHRMGLYDAILIKENHIEAAGSITAAMQQARQLAPNVTLEVEVENMAELAEAIAAGAKLILIDNFDITQMHKAVIYNNAELRAGRSQAKLEASGGVNFETVRSIANTGVDYIAIGGITKDLKSVDFSMRFV